MNGEEIYDSVDISELGYLKGEVERLTTEIDHAQSLLMTCTESDAIHARQLLRRAIKLPKVH